MPLVHALLTALLTLSTALPATASAHAFGQTFERQVGEYFVDIGCPPEVFVPGAENFCGFELWQDAANGRAHVSHTGLDVKIEGEGTVVVDTHINIVPLTSASLRIVFPQAGTYAMDVKYSSGSLVLAETSFEMTVPSPGTAMPFYGWILAAVAVAGVAAVLMKKRK